MQRKTFWNRPFSNIGQCKKLVWSCSWKCRWSRSFSLLSRTRVYTREHICTIVPAWNIHRHFYFNEDLWIIVVLPSVVTSFYRIWSNILRKLDRVSWAENRGVELERLEGIRNISSQKLDAHSQLNKYVYSLYISLKWEKWHLLYWIENYLLRWS